MNSMYYEKKNLIRVVIAFLCLALSAGVFAFPAVASVGTVITSNPTVIPGTDQQVRGLKTTETKWTGVKKLPGQGGGTVLDKGDYLTWTPAKKESQSINVTADICYKAATVSIAVPFTASGSKAKGTVSFSKKVPSDGKWLLMLNKKVTTTVKYTQVRNVKWNGKKYVPVDGAKGKWRLFNVNKKSYYVETNVPSLKKVN